MVEISSIPERLKQLRQTLGLSRVKFGEEIDTSPSTIQAIEQKGQIPRSDLLEKVSNRWPEYSMWILSGRTDLPSTQIEPELHHFRPIQSTWRIIQQLGSTNLRLCAIKPEWLEKVVFLQGNESDDLMAVILVREIQSTDRICIKIGFGEISFSSQEGIDALTRFREYLQKTRPDLISTSEIYFTNSDELDSYQTTLEIDPNNFKDEGPYLVLASSALNNWQLGEPISPGAYF